MGLLPTGSADWLAFETRGTVSLILTDSHRALQVIPAPVARIPAISDASAPCAALSDVKNKLLSVNSYFDAPPSRRCNVQACHVITAHRAERHHVIDSQKC
jgi:hypothetical protein